MISAEVGPPSSIVAAWITQRAGMSPAVVSTASPNADGRPLVGLTLDLRPAGTRDRGRDTAGVPQMSVCRVRDRIDLERGHVRLHHFQFGHAHIISREGVDLISRRSSS